jgi:hypothetical protein
MEFEIFIAFGIIETKFDCGEAELRNGLAFIGGNSFEQSFLV